MGPRCTWLFLFHLICVVDSIIGFSRCRGYWSILLSVVCIYVCSAGYVELPIVLLYLLRFLVYHMLSKTRRNSIDKSLHRVIACIYIYICSAGYVELPVVLLYLLRCLVYHMLFKTRNSGSLHSSDR